MFPLINDFEAYQRDVRRHSPRTIRNYMPVVREFFSVFAPHDGAGADWVVRVDKSAIREFIRRPGPSGRPPTAALWNLRLSAMRSFFDYLLETEAVSANVALRLDRQRVRSKERIPLSFGELVRLVDATSRHSEPVYRGRNIAILLTLIHTALRVAEVVSLNVAQVDFEHQALADVRAKGGKSLAVAFNGVVADALRVCLADRARLEPADGQVALFVSDRGRRLSIRSVQEMVKRFGRLADIQTPVTPHVLRHSAATQLAALGTPLRVIQEICGHASVTTTERYVHVNGVERRRAIDALAARWRAVADAPDGP